MNKSLSTRLLAAILAMILAAPACVLAGHSALWGESGERWDPRGRLPDFSHAGYHAGESSTPDVPVVTNVRDFGAVGDGVTDDTAAFMAALEATRDGALLVPAGRYVINEILELNRNGMVLRGEGSGPGGTVLYFPRHLSEVTGSGPKPWEYGHGGLIWIGRDRDPSGAKLTELTAPARRGDTVITVADTSGLVAGEYVSLRLADIEDRSLMLHLHNDQACAEDWGGTIRPGDLSWPVRITSISGREVTLAQPLRIDIQLDWNPTLLDYDPVRESGVENLCIEFPDLVYRGHHQELGYNGLAMNSALNCWARDIIIKYSENGAIFSAGTKNCEMRDIRLIGSTNAITTPGPDQGLFAHHGVSFSGAADCLLSGLEVTDPTCHDVTVSNKANGNVIRRIIGLNLTLDHHRMAPFENLFSDLHAGLGARLYQSSGSSPYGPHAGARETFWNLRSSTWELPGAPVESTSWGRWINHAWDHFQTNVIPCSTDMRTEDRQWLEKVEDLEPQDLYEAQLARRLGRPIPARTRVETPVIRPQKGPLHGGAWVTLLCLTDGARIHYTLDGTVPEESSTRFTETFVLKENVVLRARAFRDGLKASEAAEYAFEVHPDNDRPAISSVSAAGDPTRVNILFDEEMDSRTAGDPDRYRIEPGIRVLSARAEPDNVAVTLTTSPMDPDTEYTLIMDDIRDLWANPTPAVHSASFTYRQPEPALVAYYPFDVDGRDLSGNENTATLHGAGIVDDGKHGGAARLDGEDDFISLPTGFLEELADFSFTAWIFMESLEQAVHLLNLNNGISGPGMGAYMYLSPEYNKLGASLRITMGGIVHDEGMVADNPWPTGRWVHVAVTLEGETASLYTDGQLRSTAMLTIKPRDLRSTSAWLGKNVYPDRPTFHGRIDEVRLHNHALSVEQVRDLMDGKATGTVPRSATLEIMVEKDDGDPVPCRVLVRPTGKACVVPEGAVTLAIGEETWFMSDGHTRSAQIIHEIPR